MEMWALRGEKEEARVEITRVEGGEGYYRELYKAALKNDLQMVRRMLEGDEGGVMSDEWEVNPLRAVIMAEKTRVRIAHTLLRHYGHDLLLKARDPHTSNTLLHLAAELEREKLATFFLKYLSKLNTDKPHPFAKQSFLDAINIENKTALHVATEKLLTSVVKQFVLEKQLKINIKDNQQKTVFDVIKDKCDTCSIKDWKTPWKISILLRSAHARTKSKLEDYEDEEDVAKDERPMETLLMNDGEWNMTTNTILLVSTLAFSLVFAAVFTVPQTLAPGGDDDNNSNGNSTHPTNDNNIKPVIALLQNTIGKSTPFKIFVVSLTLACLVMIFVIIVVIITVTSTYDMRALILCFSWSCLLVMGISLIIAYLIAVWIYMGYMFTSILIACGLFIALVLLFLAYYFDLCKMFWLSLSNLLSLTLLHGFVVTLLNNYFPECCVKRILYVLPFDT